ncbi:NAD(P)/FAD-dependent oxidoreductase [Jannaschia aquimarina]|uniref:ThcD protein n=1 Tax=Jannaschia aquimarina TaxID=935700 RepID=A0A0D1EPX6_9RHOB|nr:FAD-dependent oxidoreductase [Jannaschia aquimarina]KIT17680.1 Rhodocoxin reductase [Jannaschia aquimarina]SNS79203.1 3-phenylpropionate/trans-cinnamate dioxygenase ferredoxin reductase subunit [Jannaschia aquimarina]
MDHIAVIGAGQAGATLCETLRKRGYEGRLTLWGDEMALPYQRPPLSKAYLLGEMTRDRLLLRPGSFWKEQRVEMRNGKRVEAIDPASRTLRHAGGTEEWDTLVLATGSVPNRLPAAMGGDLEGVHVVRTLPDIERMRPDLRQGAHLLVVGGGYIGLEAAAVARKLGAEVTLVETASRLLARVAAPETARWFGALHRGHGVRILENVTLDRLEGDPKVERAVLADGTVLHVDAVICGIGIRPATDLAEAAGLTVANGIAVDDYGRTSAPGIWAIGDCASFPHRGGRIRLESVPHAIDHATCIAGNILGGEEAYHPKPWFWSDQYDVKLQIAGLNTGYEDVVVRQTGHGRSHWYFAGDTLLAVDAMNAPRDYMAGKRLIEAGRSPDRASVADPSVSAKALMG